MWEFFSRFTRTITIETFTETSQRQKQRTTRADSYLQAMATVAILLESVDIERLITTRNRVCIDSTKGALGDIPPQMAYQEYVSYNIYGTKSIFTKR